MRNKWEREKRDKREGNKTMTYIAPFCFAFFLMKKEVKSFELEKLSEYWVVL